ncbi:Nuclear distribution protein nudE [Penicillium waksmanii]|uniref:Nuclear distribution protein nudE n=1 Tax=Penicillium waksmanii TaxID=69791 RepID=UPI002547E033|nr:Nuclear distribution protein nudE [Penicillium waksmanii]KAJ5988377.1 Nuclear distribution protein nudE [Penicillium waksmanii]
MPVADDSPTEKKQSSSSSYRDELAHYKAQYEQLEAELADFQVSSRELETELEKDIEASEKRERQLKEKVDTLRYEVEEWKTKYKQSKTEGNSAQNNLQKEITSLRDTNRTLQLKLRDIEVANDDYERQARNTTSSLEDMEYKHNSAIERGVLLEEEMREGEQEREGLRIQNQRLRDELTDLKVEAEIIQEKLRNAEGGHAFRRRKHGDFFACLCYSTSQSIPGFFYRHSPSPPISESSSSLRRSINATPTFPRQRAAGADAITSRTLHNAHNARTQPRPVHSRTSSLAYSNPGRSTPSIPSRNSLSRTSGNALRQPTLPKSGSLYQIRGLIGKMQKLEERVQSAKSRLPAPSETSSRGSPHSRAGSVVGDSPVASNITVRRNSRKRLSGSSFGSSVRDSESGTPSYLPQSRQSFGARTGGDSRPSSRTSYSSRSSFSQSVHSGVPVGARPESRSSRPGAKTPLGHYSTNPTTESRRPRSSLSNNAGQGSSVGGMSHIEEDLDLASTPTTSRIPQELRRPSFSATATPGTLKKRTTSGVSAIPTPRSFKSSIGPGPSMAPPADRRAKVNDLGETF